MKAGPNGWNLKDPGSWNAYVYASDDPVNHDDPSGLDDEGPPGQFCDFYVGNSVFQFPIVYCTGIAGGSDVGTLLMGSKNAASRLRRHQHLNEIERGQAALAFANLSENCDKALQADGIDPNLVAVNASSTEYYSTYIDGNLPVQQVSGYDLGGAGMTLSGYLDGGVAASLLGPRGVDITNQVVLGPGYFVEDAVGQNVTLVHEALHTALNLGDIQLAAKLGLGDFSPSTLGVSPLQAAAIASNVITAFLSPQDHAVGGLQGTDCTK